jgi:FkbM family methyltransferase
MNAVVENLIFDVGLHSGEDTDFYLKKGFSVVGFEAVPDLVEQATARFGKAIAEGRFHIVAGAIAPAAAGEKVAFYANPGNPIWGTIVADFASRNQLLGYPSERIEVPRVDMAEMFKLHGMPFYLKIDVEGADRLILEELKKFKDRPQLLSLESEKVEIDKLRAEMDILRDLGYKKFKIVQQANIPGSKLRTRALDGQAFDYVFAYNTSGPFGEDLPTPWLTYAEALREYDAVFQRYKYFGDYSFVAKMPRTAQKIARTLYRIGTGHRGPLPGWFDTHASL